MLLIYKYALIYDNTFVYFNYIDDFFRKYHIHYKTLYFYTMNINNVLFVKYNVHDCVKVLISHLNQIPLYAVCI